MNIFFGWHVLKKDSRYLINVSPDPDRPKRCKKKYFHFVIDLLTSAHKRNFFSSFGIWRKDDFVILIHCNCNKC